MNTAIVTIIAIIAITAIELYALRQHVNGKLLALTIGTIAALGGATASTLLR